ncbi:MAG: ribosome silencing factor [Omnitrophica bacterium RIFCSPLOWO2_12_FULL_44_17]|uniref:Ribosomal silencing factor RsfS n=1 Tax=Candidatus Danuiimicrobium aquiferis TaxID=1801832 RepID=A0A1G1KVF1_9BACT|nr:MAG: ribosome silencing factor [Omnitrophica bacterium RIFCSPHIGHO2_02_FULL_45_28]OGW90435.1 MAG: ribosome silencing factor [Omnitrophica bacterium RIFCSPHIGHO2_12_FULL_44_12]OGW96944.1 MAG: ribosome silencing factor [Omnitrophica bacterium RIFCSPLOWO2_12_FULL_44_17]OGX03920.1 MAG: ribosome silencing factor [Omnitrophica bacterium RIFCSPLOWO2_02_FULL_44_11]
MNARNIVLLAKNAAEEKMGVDPVVLDVRELTDIADYFLIVHGTSDRHVRTLADHIMDVLDQNNVRVAHVEGLTSAKWVLLDYSNVMIHVFYYETRSYYHLGRLWGEAKVVKTIKGTKKNEKRTKKAGRPHSS